MPKIVDHAERREEILLATWRVIARLGVEGTTIREIAKEAGYSNGVLSHYFENKDDIFTSASQLTYLRVAERTRTRNRTTRGIQALRTAIYEALPLDEDRRLEAIIDVNFWAFALSNPRLNETRRQSVNSARQWWMDLLRDGRELGEIVTTAPDEVLADDLQCLIRGIEVEAVLRPQDMVASRQVALAELFLSDLQR